VKNGSLAVVVLLLAMRGSAQELDGGEPLGVSVEVDAGVSPLPDPSPQRGEGDGGVKRFTGVQGRVTDARTGEGLIEATVKVVAGAKKSALTDLEGHYKLKLPPGTYDLRVFYELYEGRRVGNVVVKAGEAVTLDVALARDSRAVQEVVVEAKVDKRNEAALLQERKKAVVAQDAIGAQEMARTPDANAGDAVKRVVSATVVDGKYVFLRGLGGRYALTLLNGTLMPSPEPDEPTVPLDLFPVALLSNLNVVKTYGAELPATFGGGALTIDTNTFPTQFELKARLQGAGDSMTTFQQRPDEPASALESLGLAAAPSRQLPAAVPRDVPLTPARLGSKGVTPQQQEAAGESFSQRWTPGRALGLPSASLGVTVGDTLRLGKEARVGYLLGAQVSRKERRQRLTLETLRLDEGQPVSIESAVTEIGTVSGATSLLGNVGVQLNRDHELNLLSLALWNADTSATQSAGFDQQQMANVTGSRLQLTERQLFFNQLKGFHRLHVLNDAEVEWQANYSRVVREEPDIRDLRSLVNDDGSTQVRFQPNSVERFFLTLGEDSGGGTASLTVPWRTLRLKAGGLGQYSARAFDGRRFRYLARLSGEQEKLPIAQLLEPDTIGPPLAGSQQVSLEETTLTFDRYDASLAVYGGYVTADWKATEWLRGAAGVRVEGSTLELGAGSPFATGGAPTGAPVDRTVVDVVPTVNLLFAPRADLNLRLAYSYTLARPTFRELAPFLFFDMVRRRNVSGNPALVNTRIHNGDARVEWFPGADEVFAATVFGKQFVNPIERVIVGANNGVGDLGYANTPGATLLGLELEARASLGRLARVLEPLHVGANASLIYSRIQLAEGSPQTNRERPLQGQSPYVANAFLTWSKPEWGTEAGVFYNVYGPRISEVGIQGLPDVVEQPFHRLDVTVTQRLGAGFQLKLAATNVLNQSVRLQQAGVDVLTNPPGVQVMGTLSWTLSPPERK
jgi:outer membrane receptor protein involved in Fe transport